MHVSQGQTIAVDSCQTRRNFLRRHMDRRLFRAMDHPRTFYGLSEQRQVAKYQEADKNQIFFKTLPPI